MSVPPFPPSDHFDGRAFFNPGVDTDRTLRDIWRWRRTAQRTAWPPRVADPPVAPPPDQVGPGEAAFTFIGQATYLIRTPEAVILTDPFLSDRASPFAFAGPRRVRPPGVPFDKLPRIDIVLLSHNHYDHMDLPALRALHRRDAAFLVTGLGNGRYLARKGVPGAVELDWWGALDRTGLKIRFVPAQHWSSRTLRDRRQTLWGGFVIESTAGRIYFAGDTGYFDGFGRIRERFGSPDVALLPIGAYEPRWFMKAQHMNPAEAVQAHIDLGARQSLGMHWGTVQLTDEGIDEPRRALDLARAAQGLAPDAFLAPVPGETVVTPRGGPGPTVG